MFERSPEGVENRRLFYGTDILVYCEGEKRAAFPTADGHFWQIVFGSVFGSVSVRAISFGSKTEVLALHSISKRDPNVFYAVDSDLEHLTDRGAIPRLVKTYAYSFENDLFDREVILEWIDRLPVGGRRQQLKAAFNADVSKLERLVLRLGLLNVKRFRRTGKIFGKEASRALLDLPELRLREEFIVEWRALGTSKCSAQIPPEFSVWFMNACSGDAGLRLVYQWFVKTLMDGKLYKMPSFSSFVEGLLAARQRVFDVKPCARCEYYRGQIRHEAPR